MTIIAPLHSRSEVNKAGRILIDVHSVSMSEQLWAFESIKSLKRAFPNHFLDTHEFNAQIKRYFDKFGD